MITSWPPRSPKHSSHIEPWQSAAERQRELARLLPLWPGEIADVSESGRKRLIATLTRALRAERKRARGGHWAYEIARHAALHRAYQRELLKEISEPERP